jgi:hypothetical protein
MKKYFLIALVALIFSACIPQNEYITEVVEAPNTYTRDFKVRTSDWKLSSDDTGYYYYCQFSEPKLTNEILDYGILQAFYYYSLRDNFSYYVPLPYEDFWADNLIEYFTVEFKLGAITFIYKTTQGEANPPQNFNTYDFRVRFLW